MDEASEIASRASLNVYVHSLADEQLVLNPADTDHTQPLLGLLRSSREALYEWMDRSLWMTKTLTERSTEDFVELVLVPRRLKRQGNMMISQLAPIIQTPLFVRA